MTTCPWTPEVAASLGMPFTCATLETPTTYRARFDESAAELPHYRLICISRLGAEYGDKGSALPMCDTHDATARTIETLIAPPAPLELAMGVPWTGVFGGGGGGDGGMTSDRERIDTGWFPGLPPVVEVPDRPPFLPPPDSPSAVPPVPLPGGLALLAVAIVALRRFRR